MNLDLAEGLCKVFEGFKSKPYLCPAGIPTIGYGSTYYLDGRKVTLQDAPITEEAAAALLRHELAYTFLPGVLRLCPKLKDERKINALVDFCYNLGVGRLQTSTLRRMVNAERWDDCKTELRKWNKSKGVPLRGLTLRREAECKLF